jgi:colanic acid/amylovoran biosynthesis glycosyltransferase
VYGVPARRVYRLAVLATRVGERSETFIRRHIDDLLPGDTLAIGRPVEVLDGSEKVHAPVLDPHIKATSSLERLVRAGLQRWRRGAKGDVVAVERILGRYGVQVVLGEYLDASLRYLDAANRIGVPFFVHAHGYDVSMRLRDDSWRRQYLRYTDAAGVITMSAASRERLSEIGLPRDKIHVIPYGVDIPPRISEHVGGPQVRCLAVGRLVPKKAPLLLLDAFHRAVRMGGFLHLDYVGSGDLMPAVEQFVRERALQREVTLHGALPNPAVRELMRRSDVFVQHSVMDPETGDEEGLPVAILEAMAHGLPVVSTRHAGIPEAVIHEETGWLVEEGDSRGMGEAIAALAQDPDRRARMGQAAWARARDHFSWQRERSALLTLLGLGPGGMA